MYTAYYGFSEKPFALSPDPKYLFLSATHREVLGHLVYGIEQGEGFMAISGEVGTGKTTLCRTLLDRLGASCEIAFLFNPMLGPTDLIKAINAEFGLSTFGDSRPELVDVLNTFLLEKHHEGRRVLVIIDEAQNLPDETLEQLRLLSNLESRTAKLLQIILIGQPELDEKLGTRKLRQLRQRITVWWSLGPLTRAETREYVRHRLRVAGGSGRPIFSEAALDAVARYSAGVPRLVNVLCDRSLLAGYGDDSLQIGPRTVRTVAREIRLARTRRRWPLPLAIALGTAAAGAIAALAFFRLQSASPPDTPEPPPPVAAAPAPIVAPAMPEASPLAPPSPEPELAPGPPSPLEQGGDALDATLSLHPDDEGNALVLDATLGAWRLPGAARGALSFPELLAALEARELRLLRIDALADVDALGLPALLQLQRPDGSRRTVLLQGIGDAGADLAGILAGQVVRVPPATLAERFSAPAYAVWRDFEGLPPMLGEGGSGIWVEWLQEALAGLGHYAGPISGLYDGATREAVVRFQRSAGIPGDGVFGPLTQIRLYQALPDYSLPTLVRIDATRTATAP